MSQFSPFPLPSWQHSLPQHITSTTAKSTTLHSPHPFFSIHSILYVLILALLCGMIYVMIYHIIPSMISFMYHKIMGIPHHMTAPTYLMHYVTYQPPTDWAVSTERFRRIAGAPTAFGLPKDTVDFCMRVLATSGLGETTSFPPGIMSEPPNITLPMARAEAETVMFSLIDDLLASTGIPPRAIDILIINCSLFVPTPSLTSMCVHRYGMRSDIQTYNLGGMGCSAGLIAINLAHDILASQSLHHHTRPSLALVISTENITQNIYLGAERNMTISNALFRVGGAAILLSNAPIITHHTSMISHIIHKVMGTQHTITPPLRAKFVLEHLVRTHLAGVSDAAFHCVEQDIDSLGHMGVRLSRDLMEIAGKALKLNITTLAPKILSWKEMFRFALIECLRFVHLTRHSYTPNFTSTISHFCIHAGGRGVIDTIQQHLKLSDRHVEPSRETLKSYGNTSSSSIWYEMSYIENQQKQGIKRGDKIWQIAFGSGFKCNSAVWRVL